MSSDAIGRQIDDRLMDRLARPAPRTGRPSRNLVVTPEFTTVNLEQKQSRDVASCCFHPDKIYEVGRYSDQDPTLNVSRFARDLHVPTSARIVAPTTKIMGLDMSENFVYK